MLAIVLLALCLWPGRFVDLNAIGRWVLAATDLRPVSPAERFLESVRDRPVLLRNFLQQFPKGGDLHVHLSGAVYLERLANGGDGLTKLCVVGGPIRIIKCTRGEPHFSEIPLNEIVSNKVERWRSLPQELRGPYPFQRLIDALTLRHFVPGEESSADRFFDAFSETGPLFGSIPLMLDELKDIHHRQGLQYIEVMLSLQNFVSADELEKSGSFSDAIAKKANGALAEAEWRANEEIKAADLAVLEGKIKEFIRGRVAAVVARLDDLPLGACSITECHVEVRLVQQLIRTAQPQDFYAQLLFARELLGAEKENHKQRVVGLNIVSPEHDRNALAGARAQMAMIKAVCADKSPCNGKIAIHAGELRLGLAPPADLQWHIGAALDAGARRIGHGVAIGHEATPQADKPFGLFDDLSAKRVAIEINLTSNQQILGVSGADHPLRDYMSFGVPVVISTDDEGISRSDVTNEWVKAVREQSLGYRDLVRLARNSLEYSFLDGDSLWEAESLTGAASDYRRVRVCLEDRPSGKLDAVSEPCKKFLTNSPKARHQWVLEHALATFGALDWDGLRNRLSNYQVRH